MSVSITLIGGPTALIEIDGFRQLTDPTFDAPGQYRLPHVTLEKLVGPALSAEMIGEVDAVLLSHDQHSDNLDHSGKAFLAGAKRVLTTEVGAGRLGAHAEGFAPWATTELSKDGKSLTVTEAIQVLRFYPSFRGDATASSPESRNSGPGPSDHPGMTVERAPSLLRFARNDGSVRPINPS